MELEVVAARLLLVDLQPLTWQAMYGGAPVISNAPGHIRFDQVSDWMLDYERFLALLVMYPGVRLAPSKHADFAWHFHMWDTIGYRVDTWRTLGVQIDHYPYTTSDDGMDECFDRTQELMLRHFGEPFRLVAPTLVACEGGPVNPGNPKTCVGARLDPPSCWPSLESDLVIIRGRKRYDFERLPILGG